METPLVSIVSVNYKQAAVTCGMLDSLRDLTYPWVEVLLVDNGATERQGDLFTAHYPDVSYLFSPENLGFAGGNNLAIPKANGTYILLLNNDTVVPPSFLEPLVAAMEADPAIGVASPKIYYFDQPDMLQYAGAEMINPYTGRGHSRAKLKRDIGQFNQSEAVGMAHGACMLIRREVVEDIGLLAEDYFMYYEELDYCDRAREKGWQCYYVADSHILHKESMSMGKRSPLKTYYMFRNRWLFMRKRRQGWPYYCFVAYFLLVGLPKHLLQHTLRREKEHIKAIFRGIFWNLGIN